MLLAPSRPSVFDHTARQARSIAPAMSSIYHPATGRGACSKCLGFRQAAASGPVVTARDGRPRARRVRVIGRKFLGRNGAGIHAGDAQAVCGLRGQFILH